MPLGWLSSLAKEIATPIQTVYKALRCRIIRTLVEFSAVSPACISRLIGKVLAWSAYDMATQGNTETIAIPFIPDHQLVRRIGRGAYGEVWLARTVLGTFRGIKIIRRTTFDDDRPFDREFEGIQKFEPISRSHPGFVSILQVGRNDAAGLFYYVMEVADDVAVKEISPDTYVPRNLSREVRNRGRLPVSECIEIGLSLSAALSYLHRQGLIHRDIKPSNIIYINGTPRLADVGLVATAREQHSGVGTLGYIPDKWPGTVGADVYGLGKVLYHIAFGEDVKEFPRLATSVVEQPDWTRFAALNSVINRACAADPAERYQDAGELHAALAALLEKNDSTKSQSPAASNGSGNGARKHPHVTVLYKPGADLDVRLLQVLERSLGAHGIDVFFDKCAAVGVQWAQEIETRIRAADAVVILLSETSVQSEMLAYEVEMADHAAQQQHGRPLRLPVRVQFNGSVSDDLQAFLGPLQSFSWNGPQDDERLVSDIVRALEATTQERAMPVRPRIEPAGGAVDLDSKYYVVRPTDHAFREAVTRWDSIVLVKGARQMGKTSLLARGLSQARTAGARVALSDFQKLSLQNLESAESFFLALGTLLSDQLELDVIPEDSWDKRRSPNMNFERFLRKNVLGQMTGHLVWGLDEVDRLFTCKFGSEVFGLFRSWHNERALDPTGPWSRLTLAIAYATEAHLFITDVNQSPFNVGTRLDLEDFTFAQVADLNQRYGSPIRNADLNRFYDLLGGQPYLVRRALDELVLGHVDFESLVAHADSDEGIFGDHLRRILVMLAKDPGLMQVVRDMLHAKPCPDVSSFYRLRSGGLVRGDSMRELQPRCQIYASYLKRHLR